MNECACFERKNVEGNFSGRREVRTQNAGILRQRIAKLNYSVLFFEKGSVKRSMKKSGITCTERLLMKGILEFKLRSQVKRTLQFNSCWKKPKTNDSHREKPKTNWHETFTECGKQAGRWTLYLKNAWCLRCQITISPSQLLLHAKKL